MARKPSIKVAQVSILVALAVLACNKNEEPLGPAHSELLLPSKFQPTETKSSGDDLATMCQRDKYEIGLSSAIIGPAGGVLTRGNHRLVIPVGALSQTIKITFTMLASSYLECELKPFGFKFNTPVRLVLSYNGACDDNLDESALKVAYYSSKTQLGVLTPTAIDSALNTVTVELEKFAFGTSSVTRYALIKR